VDFRVVEFTFGGENECRYPLWAKNGTKRGPGEAKRFSLGKDETAGGGGGGGKGGLGGGGGGG